MMRVTVPSPYFSLRSCFLKQFLFILKFLLIVVTDNVFQRSLLYTALHPVQMEEAFILLCIHGIFKDRKHVVELHGHEYRIPHLSFGGAWMNAGAVDIHLRGGCIEVLIFQFA